jgi:hypothetical protein
VVARLSAPVKTDPSAHPASCAMGTGSFPGVKRPARGVDHPPTSSVGVKKKSRVIPLLPSGLRGLLYDDLFLYEFKNNNALPAEYVRPLCPNISDFH